MHRVWSASAYLTIPISFAAGAGAQSAALRCGGETTAAAKTDTTDEYDGVAWSAGGALSAAKDRAGGAGTQTAGFIFGGDTGSITNASEEYDGAAWSSGGTMSAVRRGHAGCGLQTAALAFGGYDGTTTYLVGTEEYDGAAWSTGGAITTGRFALSGCGTQTCALNAGGNAYINVIQSQAQIYDGSAWAATTELPSLSCDMGCFGGSGYSACVAGGRYTANATMVIMRTLEFNGAVWSGGASIDSSRYGCNGAGVLDAGLVMGGLSAAGAYSDLSMEYSFVDFSSVGLVWRSANVTFGAIEPVYAPAAMGNPSSVGYCAAGKTSATSTYTDAVLSYNGSEESWTITTSLSAGARGYSCGVGAMCIGGYMESGGTTAICEEFELLAWNTIDSLNTARTNHQAAGNYNAEIAYGTTTYLASAEQYNGSAWSNITDAPIGCSTGAGALCDSDPMFAGGFSNSSTPLSISPMWNGASWTSLSSPLIGRLAPVLAPLGATSVLIAGGKRTTTILSTEIQAERYTDTAWTTVAALLWGMAYGGAIGDTAQEKVLVFGGLRMAETVPVNYAEWFTEYAARPAWILGPALLTERYTHALAGYRDNALAAFGLSPTAVTYQTTAELLTDLCWSSAATSLSTRVKHSAAGTADAAVFFAGHNADTTYLTATAECADGVWSTGGDILATRHGCCGFGSASAAMMATGINASSTFLQNSEQYDGASWATDATPTRIRRDGEGAGTVNNAILAGGLNNTNTLDPTNGVTMSETYNGVTFSNATGITARTEGGVSDVGDGFLISGGYSLAMTNYYTVRTQKFNGVTWSLDASALMGCTQGGIDGSTSTALMTGGNADQANYYNVQTYIEPTVHLANGDCAGIGVIPNIRSSKWTSGGLPILPAAPTLSGQAIEGGVELTWVLN